MKKIVFLPRGIAESVVPPPRSALISIHDKSEPQMVPQQGWLDVLFQRFHDTDGQSLGLEVFSEQQAREVLAFVKKHRAEIETLYVHCLAGESRSGAVAIAISEMEGVPSYKGALKVDWQSHRIYNKAVYRTLLLVANEENTDEQT